MGRSVPLFPVVNVMATVGHTEEAAGATPPERSSGSPDCRLSRWLFLRLLGVVYLSAFASLWEQVDGLIGSRGILPVDNYLAAAHRALGSEAYWRLPTLCWLFPGDAGLHGLCGAGVVLSVLLILGFMPLLVLLGSWVCYLSLTIAGQVFLGYQWDALLLETGFLAIFCAPWGFWPWPAGEAAPSPVIRWLLRWLLFRLMFCSGMAKLVSGDPTWRDFTALDYHYETQPLPTWTSWYMHQLPGWFQQASVLVTFVLELAIPPLLFAGRRCRHWACLGIILLQVLILLTGNYGFFNLLTIALCVPQLDDSLFPVSLRRRLRLLSGRAIEPAQWRQLELLPVAGVLFVLSLVPFLSALGLGRIWPNWVTKPFQVAHSFELVNSYGLFAIMTTERPEIVVEGSIDGRTWQAYEFRWKPGDVSRPPEFTTPHLPRLDWQMWFAALGRFQDNPWFLHFLVRLLQGENEVLALLERDPFPGTPPRYIRAQLYRYSFTDAATRERTGAYWQRELLRPYCPTLTRKDSQE
jgi:lipase maturation factor 1